jgi:hypothetical protein
MKSVKITKHILLIGLIVLFLWVCPLFAEDDGDEGIDPIQAAESGILTRLNLARNNPWAEAERLGLDPEVLRAEVVPEEVAAQWDQGLWPLTSNALLNEVALQHCEDMIERGFFSHVTPEGLTPEDRVIIAGYDANIVREELGALVFNTYMDPGEAAQMLMDVLLRDSLIQRETEEGPTLLNERVVEVGINRCTLICSVFSWLDLMDRVWKPGYNAAGYLMTVIVIVSMTLVKGCRKWRWLFVTVRFWLLQMPRAVTAYSVPWRDGCFR